MSFHISSYIPTETLLFVQWSVLLAVVLTLIATRTNNSKMIKNLANFCYPRWALEAFVVANAEKYAISTLCSTQSNYLIICLRQILDLHEWR